MTSREQPDLVVEGADVVLPDGTVEPLDVGCTDGRITALSPPGDAQSTTEDRPPEALIDGRGLLLAPGFIDLQINGAFGHDFTADPGSIAAVAERLPQFGVTSFLPTVVTSPRAQRDAALDAIGGTVGELAATPLGLHFEGPSISAARAGAHDTRWITGPDPQEISGWIGPNVSMVTMAPEVPGAVAVCAQLRRNGVVVAAGHTACTVEQFEAARAAGVSYVTHLYNAMAPFSHRSPGPIGATLGDDTVVAGLICDLIHVAPAAIRTAWNALGPRRASLVTDATAALGLDRDDSRLGERRVTVGPDGVRTPEGLLAGTNLSLDRAIRNLITVTGCSPAAAVATVTAVPARVLGLEDRGAIRVGARADLVLLDRAARPVRTLIAGRTAWVP